MGAHMCLDCAETAKSKIPPLSPIAPKAPSSKSLRSILPPDDEDEESMFITIDIDSSPRSRSPNRNPMNIKMKGTIRPPKKTFNRTEDVTSRTIIHKMKENEGKFYFEP